MSTGKLSRRGFLRLAWAAAAGSVAAACGRKLSPVQTPLPSSIPATETPMSIPTPSPTQTPAIKASLTLNGGQADVWGWQKQVGGKLSGLGKTTDISVESNGLTQSAEIMNDRFSATVPIDSGENRIRAVAQDRTGEQIVSNNLIYSGRLSHRPRANITIDLEDGRLVLDGSTSQPAENESIPVVDHIWSQRANNPGPVKITSSSQQDSSQQDFLDEISAPRIYLAPPDDDGEYYFLLKVSDQVGRTDTSQIYAVCQNSHWFIPNYDKENTAWVESAIVYGVIPRNFGKEGFKSIIERLDDLQDLGINALWLAPVFVSPPGDYGYGVVDYFELNPIYGTKEDFHRLVQEAHRRDIRILMDFVPNHSSNQHPYFLDAVKYGKESPYWDFYDRDASGEPTHYFSWTHLPNLNYSNPQVERWMLEAFTYWVREFDIDGYRVDACWGVQQRKPDFWLKWRRELKRVKPDLLLLAEASARDGVYFDNGYDAAYDWTEQLGKWAWEMVFETYKNRLLVYNLDIALTNHQKGYSPDALIFRFLNNNDTGQRFITKYGLEMTRVATALLLTLPGIPCIYTGDEYGESYQPYNDPQPLSWKEQFPGLRDYHKKLVELRTKIPGLHSRDWYLLEIQSIPRIYGYLRYNQKPENQPVLVLLNFYTEEIEAQVNLPEEFSRIMSGKQFVDLLEDKPAPVISINPLKISVKPMSALILSNPVEKTTA
ncbi:MAG: alpha-amylase family glycosyl hydrolase [Omnitrophica WOR_2 bacterium]